MRASFLLLIWACGSGSGDGASDRGGPGRDREAEPGPGPGPTEGDPEPWSPDRPGSEGEGGGEGEAGGERGTPAAADCARTYQQVVSAESYQQTVTTWYADVEVPGLAPDDAPHVSVLGCDAERFATGLATWCPAGEVRCDETGEPPPALRCGPAAATFDDGRAVVTCGTRVHVRYAPSTGLPDYTSGMRWRRVLVRTD